MRHNFTLLELGWLCPALLSLLRSSPQIHSDQNSQTLVRLLNESAECKWPNGGGEQLGAVLDRALRASNPVQRLHLSQKLTKMHEQQKQQIQPRSGHGKDGEHEEDDPRIIWSMTVLYAFISLMGIVGNILVVVVVETVPGMITPTNCYLVSLAISDCLFLSAAGPVELSYLHMDQSEYAFGALGCKLLTFLPYLGINTSSMSIMAFTVERFIGICYPLRARYICTVKRAKLIILFIWCFCILYNSPWLYLATLKEVQDGIECNFRLSRDNWTYKVVFVADFMTFYMLPMFLYIYIYGKITYTLTKCELKLSIQNKNFFHRNSRADSRPDLSATFMSTLSGHDSPPSPPNTKSAHNVSSNPQRDYFVNGGGRRSSVNAKGKLQVIKMLALVVFIFAVCWLPYRAMVMYNSFATAIGWPLWDSDWFIYMSKTMIFFNCAINPVLYNLMSGRFRQAFIRLLSGKKQFINSYKRDSVCMQTAMNGHHKGSSTLLEKRRNGSDGMLLSRMAVDDAEVRATLLLKMQRNGQNRVEEVANEEKGLLIANGGMGNR